MRRLARKVVLSMRKWCAGTCWRCCTLPKCNQTCTSRTAVSRYFHEIHFVHLSWMTDMAIALTLQTRRISNGPTPCSRRVTSHRRRCRSNSVSSRICAGPAGKEQEPVREGSDVRNLEGTEIGNSPAERVHSPGSHMLKSSLLLFGEQLPLNTFNDIPAFDGRPCSPKPDASLAEDRLE